MKSEQFIKEEDFIFGKNMILIAIFFLITPLTLAVSLFSLFSLKTSALAKDTVQTHQIPSPFSGVQVYASLPAMLPAVSAQVGSSDARAELIRQYLEKYDSPIVSYAEEIVKVSDKYGLDYRLLPAIAQQESNLCKIIPQGTYNCWGWGIHSAGTLGFDSFSEGLEVVANGLKTKYIDKGYVTVDEIMSKYNPTSPGGAWGIGVASFMEKME